VKRLLLATHNPAKLEELKKGLGPLANAGIKLVSLADLGINQEPEETGKTFEENALLKAEFYANLASLPSVADDGGICIDALGGEPGVKSHMWLGRPVGDEELIKYTLKRLKNVPKARRSAYFTTTLCFYDPGAKTKLFEEGRLKGYIANQTSAKRIKGYPYRSLFIVKGLNTYYAHLTVAEHLKINHRLNALKRLMQKMKPYLLQ
jgi:XTP/dITP diphosphohydrolase